MNRPSSKTAVRKTPVASAKKGDEKVSTSAIDKRLTKATASAALKKTNQNIVYFEKSNYGQEMVKKVSFNQHKDISTLNVNEYFDHEIIYLRNNELTEFNIHVLFPNLNILDLSCNEITTLEFLEKTPALKHLTLSFNKLVELGAIPVLKKLDSLTVRYNNISTLKGFQTQSDLRTLILRDNNISTLESIPVLPRLEILDLRGNDVSSAPLFRETTIALFTKGVFAILNGENVSQEELQVAQPLRGQVAACIREGFISQGASDAEELIREAKEFLERTMISRTPDAPLQLVKLDIHCNGVEGADIVMAPAFRIVESGLNISAPAGLIRKKFELPDANASIVNLLIEGWNPISLEKSENVFAVELLLSEGTYEFRFEVDGVAQEQKSSIQVVAEETAVSDSSDLCHISVKWFRSNEIGVYTPIDHTNELVYTPTMTDVGQFIMAQVSCHRQSDKLFDIYDITPEIEQAAPCCKRHALVGDAVEGQTFVADVEYFGGIQGTSEFKWFNEDGELLGDSQTYTLLLKDVGKSVRFEYTPVRADGERGPVASAASDVVKPGVPTIHNLVANGPYVEGETVDLSFQYTGGIEGDSEITWYRFVPEYREDAIAVASGATYTPTVADVYNCLYVEYQPIGSNGDRGSPVTCETASIEPAAPCLRSIGLAPTGLTEDDTLIVEAEYSGGFEGHSKVEWFRVDEVSGQRIQIPSATSKMYKLQLEDVGYKIEVWYVPTREDGVAGEVTKSITEGPITATHPRCDSIELAGSIIEGKHLKVNASYKGGIEGNSVYKFFRNSDSEHQYELVAEHEGQNELKLSLTEVGKRLKVEYTPVRNDGVKGESVSLFSDIIKAGDPRLSDVHITGEDLVEGSTLTGEAVYFGGSEGSRYHRWVRINEDRTVQEIEDASGDSYILQLADLYCKIKYGCKSVREDGAETDWIFTDESEEIAPRAPAIFECKVAGIAKEGSLVSAEFNGNDKVSAYNSVCKWLRITAEDSVLVGTELQYKVQTDDIGSMLKLTVTPTRDDIPGILGETVEATTDVVQPADPFAVRYSLVGEAKEESAISARIEYFGGAEGESIYKWFRVDDSDSATLVQHATGATSYVCSLEDIGFRIRLEYTPVRADGVAGKAIELNSDVVFTDIPRVEDLQLQGILEEGSVLTVSARYTGGEEGVSLKQWFRVDGASSQRELVAEGVMEYTPVAADTSKTLVIVFTPVRQDGVAGAPAEVQTGLVEPLDPSMSNLHIVGQPYVSKSLTLKGTYRGGLEGNSIIEWFTSMTKEGPFSQIPGATTRKCALNSDSYLAFVKVRYTPVRNDGKVGEPVETLPQVNIKLTPTMLNAIGKVVLAVAASFDLKQSGTDVPVKLVFDKSGVHVFENGAAKGIKFAWDRNITLTMSYLNDTKFSICTFAPKTKTVTRHELLAGSNAECDFVAIVFRIFQALFADANLAKSVVGAKFHGSLAKLKPNQTADLNLLERPAAPTAPAKAAPAPVLPDFGIKAGEECLFDWAQMPSMLDILHLLVEASKATAEAAEAAN